jgi:DNA-directed RNA polymerase subunit alpha
MTTETIDMSALFEQAELNADTFEAFADAAHASVVAYERFAALASEYRARVEQGRGEPLRLAIAQLILGRYGEALENFAKAPPSKLRHFCAAQAASGLNRFDVALEEFKAAAKQGWDPVHADLQAAAIHVRAGDPNAAEGLLRKHEQAGQDRPEWYYVKGLIADQRNEREAAGAAFEKCLALDPDHQGALFRCARLYDMGGDDDAALELYQLLELQPRAYVNALLNAAVIYEDLGRFEAAAGCLRRVLRVYPNHTRARLYLKDIESCLEMVIDDTKEEHVDARTRLLDTPLSEFELSVRARNCLKKMNIRTLGELIRLTEAELLAYKNFGETSLNEIKALLTKKNLRLGQSPEEIDVAVAEVAPPPVRAPAVPPGQEATLARPVSELELSVRARRCLQRLNVQTLGDLVGYSEQDLLATRNFGVTSLNEIKTRLADHGLALSTKKPA